MKDEAYTLQMAGITKRFFGVVAVNNVDLAVKNGSVHALIGENGAGKSTLMKVLAGVHQQDEGDIVWRGSKVSFHSPKDALKTGICMIHQELSPILDMSVAENIYLGREPLKIKAMVDYKKMHSDAAALLNRVGMSISPKAMMRDLTVAQTQVVEIAKAIDNDADLIIMDEPTSALSNNEIETLFGIIRQLKDEGRCIIYITHKLDEVFAVTDAITVLRDGRAIGTYPTEDMTKDLLIKKMVDRELKELFPRRKGRPGEDIKLSVRGMTKGTRFTDISYDVHCGEILGFAGLLGSGRSESMTGLFGVDKLDKGEITIDGKAVVIKRPKDAIRLGMAFVTEDRKQTGLVLPLCVRDNLTLPHLTQLCKMGFYIQKRREKEASDDYVRRLRIKITGLTQLVQNLSGGNQQKVIIGKWLMNMPKILILDEPTRGIDVGAKAEIYQLISDLADNGMTILLISSEMEEILGMCDRIVVFHEGKVSGQVLRDDATQESILTLATGA